MLARMMPIKIGRADAHTKIIHLKEDLDIRESK
jgi:hypothetical protein